MLIVYQDDPVYLRAGISVEMDQSNDEYIVTLIVKATVSDRNPIVIWYGMYLSMDCTYVIY